VRSRRLGFALLAGVCLIGVAVSLVTAVLGADKDREVAARAVVRAAPKADEILTSGKPFAVMRSADKEHAGTLGQMVIAPLAGTEPGAPVPAGPICQRVAVGAGTGLCLDVLGTKMSVKILGSEFETLHSLTLAGIPSRARISPDGRWGGVTAFVVGHAYTSPGEFSTATTIIDLRSGKAVVDLEKDVRVTNGGKMVEARDRNFWGLTFAGDGDTFYATLATGGDTWLIKGSIKGRRAETIHENVECPSLSPDGTRIAYKKAIAQNPAVWRFHVLDLATGKETALAETRSVDDQLFWLDEQHLLYGADEQIWVVDADGSGAPSVWMKSGDSPSVQGVAQAAP
jgi:hypothetical protein